MELIIFQPGISKVSYEGYRNSVKMGYLINANVACAGIGEQIYYMDEILDYYTFEQKIDTLQNANLPEKDRLLMVEIEQELWKQSKVKNKSSRELVTLALLKKTVKSIHERYMMVVYVQYEKWFGLNTMKSLLNRDYFYFYNVEGSRGLFTDAVSTLNVDLLTLKNLHKRDNGYSLFFLNFDNKNGEAFGSEICSPESKMSEDRTHIYGMQSFVFPYLDSLSTNEIAEARRQMLEPSEEFRQKIEQWTYVCYKCPDSNMGLNFFRDELMAFMTTLQNKTKESQILRNAGTLSHDDKQSQIIIGEAPIAKIWEYYKDTSAISKTNYDDLMRLKKEQFPKYEGRWPVFIYKSMGDDQGDVSLQATDEKMISARKTISVD